MIVTLMLLIQNTGITSSDRNFIPYEQDQYSTYYNDTCDYNAVEAEVYRCGDTCMSTNDHSLFLTFDCRCGPSNNNNTINFDEEFCCIPSDETCEMKRGNVFCSEGRKLPMSSHCHNSDRSLQCHNSYQDSEDIGLRSHYTCPHTCVSWQDMCRGVNWCGKDYEECGPHLRCYRGATNTFSLTSSLVHDHHYCRNDNDRSDQNNRIYDVIDRSDESDAKSVEGTSYDIDPDLFPACNDSRNNPGVMCESTCMSQFGCLFERQQCWCDTTTFDGIETKYCQSFILNDQRLCGNPLVFSNVPCTENNPDGTIGSYGMRCSGSNMQCIKPWYTHQHGEPFFFGEIARCDDKSDQIFTINKTCREHLQQYITFHDDHFCNLYPWLQNELICKNKNQWLSEHDASFSDPHSCHSSCSNPGPDCVACTNPEYFNCSKSGQCLHPDLECDGHPQCPWGEDEDLDRCYSKYVKRHIIEPFASYRCASVFYEKYDFEIFATPCNGKKECTDNSDESGCQGNPTTSLVLTISLLTILLVYIVSHYSRGGLNFRSRKVCPKIVFLSTQELLEKYENSHDDKKFVQELNLHLHHSEHTHTVEQKKKTLIIIFDFIGKLHNNCEAEIYFYLRNNFDPVQVQQMIDAKYPGIIDSLMKWIEKFVRRPILTEITSFIIRTESAMKIKENMSAIISVEVKFLDIFKDLGISILMLKLIGGPQAISDFPTNFGSVIVICMFASIFIPMLISSLHLAANNFDMFLPKRNVKASKYSKLRICLVTALLFLLSPLHPVFLETLYLQTAEEAREMARCYKTEVVQKKLQCRKIKKQLANFMWIELGS